MENQEKKPEAVQSKPKKSVTPYLLVEMGTEFAFILAIPLLVFIYLGKWLDTKTHHHFFVIIGILVGLAISWYMIFRKIMDIKKML